MGRTVVPHLHIYTVHCFRFFFSTTGIQRIRYLVQDILENALELLNAHTDSNRSDTAFPTKLSIPRLPVHPLVSFLHPIIPPLTRRTIA